MNPTFNLLSLQSFTLCGRRNKKESIRNKNELRLLVEDIADNPPSNNIMLFNMILGRIININNARYGYIQVYNGTDGNGAVNHRTMASHNISLNEHVFMKHFINIPIKIGNEYLGAIGWGRIHY